MKKFRVLYGTISEPETHVVYYSCKSRQQAVSYLLKALNPRYVSHKNRVHINSITEVESVRVLIAT